MKCNHCGSTEFRTSKLRKPDLSHLLLLRYPVRCRVCFDRAFVSIFLALKLRQAEKIRHREERRNKKNQESSPTPLP
jgi:hypothetical protein